MKCRACGTRCDEGRTYCSLSCSRNISPNGYHTLQRFLEGVDVPRSVLKSKYVREHVLDRQNRLCAICGNPQEHMGEHLLFIMNHSDGNPDNTHPSNMRMVCPNCLSQLPTYKSRNRGNGRYLRDQRSQRVSNLPADTAAE